MRNSRSLPRGSLRFSVIARLFEFSIAIGKVVLLHGGARRRRGWACGGSILMTSAPAVAISRVAYGPWYTCPKSSTVTPASGMLARGIAEVSSAALEPARRALLGKGAGGLLKILGQI